jgi:predicted 3-demethylubiquinone-9 3-methyltransferase (glyoxalase superfamily)
MAPKDAKLSPFLWFDKEARQAARFYARVFKGRVGRITVLKDTPSGSVEVVELFILGQRFTLMSAGPFAKFTEAISFEVRCKTQKEIDHYWRRLSADPKAEQCGWLKDKFGVSWQVTPLAMDRMLADKDKLKVARVTQAFLKMKKFNLKELERAYRGR